mmetsp:Transcript_28046/g.56212  ORF Transcript_28046/g.56212 Transcript_28046/m.56212 type:complete len:200 (-) Transcript_28046:36-635(-)
MTFCWIRQRDPAKLMLFYWKLVKFPHCRWKTVIDFASYPPLISAAAVVASLSSSSLPPKPSACLSVSDAASIDWPWPFSPPLPWLFVPSPSVARHSSRHRRSSRRRRSLRRSNLRLLLRGCECCGVATWSFFCKKYGNDGSSQTTNTNCGINCSYCFMVSYSRESWKEWREGSGGRREKLRLELMKKRPCFGCRVELGS